MKKKLLDYLKMLLARKIDKNLFLLLLTIFASVSLSYLPGTAQNPSVPAPVPSTVTQPSISDTRAIAQMITKVENNWKRDYENYFQEDFLKYSQTADEISARLSEIRQQTKLNPAVIWAVTKPEKLQLFLITPNNQQVNLDNNAAGRATIIEISKQLHSAIVDPLEKNSKTYLPSAKLLYKWLIAPLEPYLQSEKIDTLLFCTGVGLRSLPLAVLHDGDRFLAEKYNIARIPAFSLTDTRFQEMSGDRVLAMGASQFSDLPNIPGVETELETITPTLWSGTKILNQGFTIENLKSQRQQGKYAIVHLATHSMFNPGSPQDSFIQFFDRKLNLQQIKDLQLNEPPVDLLVLSSCETAVGNEQAEFGFAGLAMQAGVKSALASLWGIDDTGTVALMGEFYQNLKTNASKAQALRQAQIAMIKGDVQIEDGKLRGSNLEVDFPQTLAKASPKNLSHPYYWSGFTLIGNPW
jgi:CHAT domain-containing protein